MIFASSFQFYVARFLLLFRSSNHPDIHNRILQFHLLKECSSNHTNKRKEQQAEEEQQRNPDKIRLRTTNEATTDSRALRAFPFSETCVIRNLLQSLARLFTSPYNHIIHPFIHRYSVTLLIRSAS